MSPEQTANAKAVDGRSDLYSLACVVYEMLGGQPPFTGPTIESVAHQHLSVEPASILNLRPTVPAQVASALARALAKAPADRFSPAAQFAEALRAGAVLESSRTVTPIKSKAVMTLLAGLAIAVLLGALAIVLTRPPEPLVAIKRQLTFTGRARSPALSPDGQMIAYWSHEGPLSDSGQLMVQDLSGGDPLPVVTAVARLHTPRWSPDGRSLLFTTVLDTTGGLFTVPRLGGLGQRLGNYSLSYDYHPGGESVMARVERDAASYVGVPDVGPWDDYLRVIDVSTGDTSDSLFVGSPFRVSGDLDWSPDGQWIALLALTDEGYRMGVMTFDGTIVESWPTDARGLRWNAASDAIYYFQSQLGRPVSDLMKIKIDPRTGMRIGNPTVVMSSIPTPSWGGFDISGDGSTIVYSMASVRGHVWSVTAETMTSMPMAVMTRQITTGTARHRSAAISPDGETVAFVKEDQLGNNIYVMPFDGGSATPVTATAHDYWGPRWSPDGTRLLFDRESRDTGERELMLADLSGARSARSLGTTTELGSGAEWFPDGRRVLLFRRVARSFAVLDLQDNGIGSEFPFPDSLPNVHSVAVSPDGMQLAVSAGSGFYRISLRDQSWIRLPRPSGLHGGLQLLWSNDGFIYFNHEYVAGREARVQQPRVWRIPVSGGTPELYLETGLDCPYHSISMARDAKRVVCIVETTDFDIWIAQNFDRDVR